METLDIVTMDKTARDCLYDTLSHALQVIRLVSKGKSLHDTELGDAYYAMLKAAVKIAEVV